MCLSIRENSRKDLPSSCTAVVLSMLDPPPGKWWRIIGCDVKNQLLCNLLFLGFGRSPAGAISEFRLCQVPMCHHYTDDSDLIGEWGSGQPESLKETTIVVTTASTVSTTARDVMRL